MAPLALVVVVLGMGWCVEGANLVYKAASVQSTHDLSAQGDINAGGDCRCGGDSVNQLASWFVPADATLNVVQGDTQGVGMPNGTPFGEIQEAWNYLSERVMRGPVTISVTNCLSPLPGSLYLRGKLTHPVRLLFEPQCELVTTSNAPALVIDGPSIVLSSNLTISKSSAGVVNAGVVVRGSGSSLSLVSPERTPWFEPLAEDDGGSDMLDMYDNVVLNVRPTLYKTGVLVSSMGRLNTFDGLIQCFAVSSPGQTCVRVRSNSVGEYLRVESLPGVVLHSALGSVVHIHQIEESMPGRSITADTGSVLTNQGSPASQFSSLYAKSNAHVSLEGVTLDDAYGQENGFLELKGGSVVGLELDTGSTMMGDPVINGHITVDHASLLKLDAAYSGAGISAKRGSKVIFAENVAISNTPTIPPLLLESSHALFLKDFQATGHTLQILALSSTITTSGTWTSTMNTGTAGPGFPAVDLFDSTFATAGAVSISGHLTTGLSMAHSTASSQVIIRVTSLVPGEHAISMASDSGLHAAAVTLDGGRLNQIGGEVSASSFTVTNTNEAIIITSGIFKVYSGVLSGRVKLGLNAVFSTITSLSIDSPTNDCLHLETGATAELMGVMTCNTGKKGVVALSGSSIDMGTTTMDTGNTCIEASGGASVFLKAPFACDRATNMPLGSPLLRAEGGAVIQGGDGTFANLTGSVGSGDCLAASSNGVVDLDSVHCENYHRLASADFGASVAVNSLNLITPPWSSTDCVRQWHTGTVAAKLEGPNAPLCEGLGVSSWCASGSNVSFVASPTEPTTSAYSFLHSC